MVILFSWAVIGILVPTIVGIGVGVMSMTPPEFLLAKGCFTVAATLLTAKAAYWLSTSTASRTERIVAGLIVGLAFFLWAESWQWVSGRQPKSQDAKTPEIALRFVSPQSPALIVLNQSDRVVREIKWWVVLWNMDLPERNDPLPIPTSTFDWIKAHDEGGAQNLFFTPLVQPLLKHGNRLFGTAGVTCPDCTGGRNYVLYIEWEKGGWFAETTAGEGGKMFVPPNFLQQTREAYFRGLDQLIPSDKRISIPPFSPENGASKP